MARASQVRPAASRGPSTGGKQPPFPPRRYRCSEEGCPWSYHRKSDLERHRPKHMSEEEKRSYMIICPEPNCTHATLQKSNIITHYNSRHTGLKPYLCDECSYCASDPSCMYHHRRALHGYVPGRKLRALKRESSSDDLLDVRTSFSDDAGQSTAPAYPQSTSSCDADWAPSPPATSTSFDSFPSPSESSSPTFGSATSPVGGCSTPESAYATYSPASSPGAASPSASASSFESPSPTDVTPWPWFWTPTPAGYESMFGSCDSDMVAATARPGPPMLYPAERTMHFSAQEQEQEQMLLTEILAYLAEPPLHAPAPMPMPIFYPSCTTDAYGFPALFVAQLENVRPFEGEWHGVIRTN
ncbi:hypothetical protein B0H11DRAFT_2015741 [Mycena galericulata]|nr:hypothetical protein B0H11DRAFT_2015741 [Mycena galericulata]